MINNEMRDVQLLTFTTGQDAYGQQRQLGTTETTIQMMVKIKDIALNDNPSYADVDLIGLTKEIVKDENQIVVDDVHYEVLYVIPTRRYNEVFLKQVK